MTKTVDNRQPARKTWQRPAVQKIAAGQAEVFTTPRRSDGQFSTS